MPVAAFLIAFGLDALRVAGLLACCLGPGLALVQRLPGLAAGERRLLALVTGLCALGTLLSLLALAGGFDRVRILTLLLLAQAAWYPVLRRQRLNAPVAVHEPLDSGNPLLAGALPLAGALAIALLLAAYPPSGFDDTMYHLPLAEGLVEHGRPTFEPELRFPAFPQFQETLMAALFALGGGETSAHLLSAAQLLLLGGVVTCWARRLAAHRLSSLDRASGPAGSGLAAPWSAALATALLLGSPLFVWLAGSAYVDLAFALFAVAALWLLDLERKETLGGPSAGPLVLAGALAGAAAAVKYHGLFFLGVALLVGAGLAWRRRRPAALAAMTIAALLTACPWYVHITVVTGNPVFPFLSSVFGANPWSFSAVVIGGPQGWTLGEPTWPGWGPALWRLGMLALDLVRSPLLLFQDSLAPPNVPPLSPFAALVLPVAAALGLGRRETRWLAITALAYLALWLVNVRDARYLAPAAAVMAVMAAPIVARLAAWTAARGAWGATRTASVATPARAPWIRRAFPALLVVLLFSPAWAFGALRVAKRGLPPVTEAARGRYLDRWLPGHALLACAGRTLGPEITIYGLGLEQLQYYARGRLLGEWGGPYRYARVAPLLGDPEALAAELKEMGADLFLASSGAVRVETGQTESSAAPLHLLARCQGFELWEVVSPGTVAPPVRRLECGC